MRLIFGSLIVITFLGSFLSLEAQESPKTAPNVLFITVDDMNTDLGSYGHEVVKSPHIDALASEGVLFDRAYAQYPVCTPSRTSFMTGVYPEQSGVLTNGVHFRDTIPDVVTMPQHFRANGYHTARVGKIYHYRVPLDIGTDGLDDPLSWDEKHNPRGADRDVEDRLHSVFPEGDIGATLSWLNVKSADEHQTDGMVATRAIEIMERNHPEKTGKPFFLAVGFFRPHVPFVAPQKYFDQYPLEDIRAFEVPEDDRDDIPVWALLDRPKQQGMTTKQQREMIRGYYASISFVDAQVGRVVQAVSDLGLKNDTIIVFLSDHGFHLGQHGLWQKSDLFEGSARAPLVISVPGGDAKGQVAKGPVELIDLYPTLVELAGLPQPAHLQGMSLSGLLQDPAAEHRGYAYSVTESRARQTRPELNFKYVMGHSIRTDRFRYTEWGPEGVMGIELYDYQTDPGELHNVVGKGDFYKTTQMKLRRLLHQRQRAMQAPISGVSD